VKRAEGWLDLWYPAPDIDALLRYLGDYEPHGYGLKSPHQEEVVRVLTSS
jgi:hypothetical protein